MPTQWERGHLDIRTTECIQPRCVVRISLNQRGVGGCLNIQGTRGAVVIVGALLKGRKADFPTLPAQGFEKVTFQLLAQRS